MEQSDKNRNCPGLKERHIIPKSNCREPNLFVFTQEIDETTQYTGLSPQIRVKSQNSPFFHMRDCLTIFFQSRPPLNGDTHNLVIWNLFKRTSVPHYETIFVETNVLATGNIEKRKK